MLIESVPPRITFLLAGGGVSGQTFAGSGVQPDETVLKELTGPSRVTIDEPRRDGLRRPAAQPIDLLD